MSPLEAAWRSVLPRRDVSFEKFIESIAGWTVHPVYLRGEAIGAILVNGPEIHACINGHSGRWFKRDHMRILNSVIEQHGYAQTHATTDKGVSFVERLGFHKHGESYRRSTPWALNR